MIAQEEKKELIDWIQELTDPEVIKNIKSIKESIEQAQTWDQLPDSAKSSIKRGIKDVDSGRVISDEDFWANFKDRL